MIKAAPPIQAPSKTFIAAMMQALESKGNFSGPMLGFDVETSVFAVAVVEEGVIVRWFLESCHDNTEARAKFDLYRGHVNQIRVLALARNAAQDSNAH